MTKWDRSKEKGLKTVQDLENAIEEIKGSDVGALFDSPKDRYNALARLRARLKTAQKREEDLSKAGVKAGLDNPEKKKRKRRKTKRTRQVNVDQTELMADVLKQIDTQLTQEDEKILYDETGLMFPQANVLTAMQTLKADAETMAGIILQNFSKRFDRAAKWYTTMQSGNSTVIVLGPVPQSIDF